MVRDFNISFGYPRTDTCGTCDQYLAKVKYLETEKKNTVEARVTEIEAELITLNRDNELHKRRAQAFYQRKRLRNYQAEET